MAKSETEITQALMEPFPRELIKQRQGGGSRMLDYIEGHEVIKRLIEATDNHFDVRVLSLSLEPPVATATVEITIPGLGSRQHIGVQAIDPERRGTEDLIKGCITDAIKKSATLFGVALDLYEMTSGQGGVSRQAPPQAIASRGRPTPLGAPASSASRATHPSPDDFDGPEYDDLPPRDAATTPAPATPSRPATEKQVKFVRALAAERGISNDDLHRMAGVAHLSDLTAAAASALIEQFQVGKTPPAQPAPKTPAADEADTDWEWEITTAATSEELNRIAKRLQAAAIPDARMARLRELGQTRRQALAQHGADRAQTERVKAGLPAGDPNRRVDDTAIYDLIQHAHTKGISESELDALATRLFGTRARGSIGNLTIGLAGTLHDHLNSLADVTA